MKKKDHKENTKVEKNKVVDLNTDNQKTTKKMEQSHQTKKYWNCQLKSYLYLMKNNYWKLK